MNITLNEKEKNCVTDLLSQEKLCIEKYEKCCETKREEDDWTEYLYEEIIID